MEKRAKNLNITKLIFNTTIFWLCGWFIFAVVEMVLRFIIGSPPWHFMILFTLLLYSGIGVAMGGVLGGAIGFLLKVVKKWQQRVEITALIMSCCITIITIIYAGFFIDNRILPLYPHLSPVLTNLVFIFFGFILFIILYMTLAGITDKTKLIVSYLALSITLYTFMVTGLYINENLLSGTFFQTDPVRILTNLAILVSSVILYLVTYSILAFIANKVIKTLKSSPLKALMVMVVLVLALGGVTFSLKKHTFLKETVVKPSSQEEDKPNIILITMDTTRADHLSCYGYHKKTTPHIDNLVQESVIFTNAYATSPWTLPSHSSIFTGLYPAKHGAHFQIDSKKDDWANLLKSGLITLAEVLAKHGYQTVGVAGSFACNSCWGLGQGFKHYNDDLININPSLNHFTLYKILCKFIPIGDISARWGLSGSRIASQMNRIVFSWLKENYRQPFFLFINYFDPHAPYLPPHPYSILFQEDRAVNSMLSPSELKMRYLLSQYDGEIAYMDYHMGRLFERLKELNIYDNTMIIITSDHGEFFGEHNLTGHGLELYEQVIKIPLIIKYLARQSKKNRSEKRVSLVDIMPTILNSLKLPVPQDLQGGNLLEDKSRVMAEAYRRYFSRRDGKFRWIEGLARNVKMLYLDEYKYISVLNGLDELYNINGDPKEEQNVIEEMPEKAKAMKAKLMKWLPYDESRISADEPMKLDESTKEGLKALGYIQ